MMVRVAEKNMVDFIAPVQRRLLDELDSTLFQNLSPPVDIFLAVHGQSQSAPIGKDLRAFQTFGITQDTAHERHCEAVGSDVVYLGTADALFVVLGQCDLAS